MYTVLKRSTHLREHIPSTQKIRIRVHRVQIEGTSRQKKLEYLSTPYDRS